MIGPVALQGANRTGLRYPNPFGSAQGRPPLKKGEGMRSVRPGTRIPSLLSRSGPER